METLRLRQADEKRLTADVGELAELVELTTVPLEGKVPQLPLRTGPIRRRHETSYSMAISCPELALSRLTADSEHVGS
jgi:hypothetical protein